MRRFLFVTCLAVITGFPAAIPAQQPLQQSDARLMSDAEYRALLAQIEATLPKWDMSLKGIDPEKIAQISYSQGKSLANERDLGLREISNVRFSILRERIQRTVHGELVLKGFLESLFSTGGEIVREESFSGLPATHLEDYAPELGEGIVRMGNDALARVEILEKGACP